jgi:hypothetical protein
MRIAELQVQGLKLDWVCVTWDGDFRFNGSGWNYHDFPFNYLCELAIPEIQSADETEPLHLTFQ